MFFLVAPGLILDAPGCHKKGAVTWQVYLLAAVGFHPKNNTAHVFVTFLYTPRLDFGCTWLQRSQGLKCNCVALVSLCSAILVPGTWVCTSHPGGNMPRKVEPKKVAQKSPVWNQAWGFTGKQKYWSWQVCLFAAVGFPPKKQQSSCVMWLSLYTPRLTTALQWPHNCLTTGLQLAYNCLKTGLTTALQLSYTGLTLAYTGLTTALKLP